MGVGQCADLAEHKDVEIVIILHGSVSNKMVCTMQYPENAIGVKLRTLEV